MKARGDVLWDLSPCIEWLFAEGGRPFEARVACAADSGFRCVEFWGARDKDVERLEAAIRDAGVNVTAFVAEPAGSLVDPGTHDDFLAGVEASCRLARRLSASNLIVVSGNARTDVDRMVQHGAIVEALRRAAPIAATHGIGLLLEPLNTRVDHPGYFLDSTLEGLAIVRDVDHPAVRLLYDLYHSIVMGEEPVAVLGTSRDLIGHVHIADVPGRHQPGTGAIDWRRQLGALRAAGYTGALGLEFRPTVQTEASLAYLRDACGETS